MKVAVFGLSCSIVNSCHFMNIILPFGFEGGYGN